MRYHITAIGLLLVLFFEIGSAMAIPIETTISQRSSVRSYTSQSVTAQQLLTLLNAAYGYSAGRRNVPEIGNAYSLVLFSVNSSGSYRYVPETNSLLVHDAFVNKETIKPHITVDWASKASIMLVIAWDKTRTNNEYLASLEAGCLVQNVYLAAVSENLGTCCLASIIPDGLRNDLRLPTTMIPLLAMPLGFPSDPIRAASPNYERMRGNLPSVQYSQSSLRDALKNMVFARAWSEQILSMQELSQLLWAAYGYSSTEHRTTPSSSNVYPLVVYVSNATGLYQYLPDSHSLKQILDIDKRVNIANVFGRQMWASNAPAIFLVAYDSAYDGTAGGVMEIEVDAGCVLQQILLESSAISLSANVVTEGFESWNGISAQALRNTLDLGSSIIPICIVPVGHPSIDTMPPDILIISPRNKYSEADVPLTFTVSKLTSWIGFSLDGKANVTITGNITLTGLSEGTHTIVVYAKDLFGKIGASATVYFTIGHQRVAILSPENKTYDATDISLTLTVSETPSWIAYSLDGGANMTITENATLTDLSYGPHNLIVYAKDPDGNTGASGTIYFSVAQKSEPFPPTLIIGALTAIAVGAAITLSAVTYRRKRLASNKER